MAGGPAARTRKVTPLQVGSVTVGAGDWALIAGPCMLESPERVLHVARGIARVCEALGRPWIFKGSFDKANRTSGTSPRGPGLHDGLAMLAAVKAELGVPVVSSNIALLWHLLRLSGIDDRLDGLGRLFASC